LSFVTTVSTPWGKATAIEELSLPQRAGNRRFTTRVELLETPEAERLVRFSYATSGSVRRGPVTLRERDLAKLAALLGRTPHLERALGQLLGKEGTETRST
jgi:hypothetical protein